MVVKAECVKAESVILLHWFIRNSLSSEQCWKMAKSALSVIRWQFIRSISSKTLQCVARAMADWSVKCTQWLSFIWKRDESLVRNIVCRCVILRIKDHLPFLEQDIFQQFEQYSRHIFVPTLHGLVYLCTCWDSTLVVWGTFLQWPV